MWLRLLSYQQSRNTGHRDNLLCPERNSPAIIVSQVGSLFLFHSHSVTIEYNNWEYAPGQSHSQQREPAETVFIIWNKESFMEHCYSVQGQSDKHIDFGTHEVADISAPTFHYGIIWFRWSLSSVPSVHSGTSESVGYGFQGDTWCLCLE